MKTKILFCFVFILFPIASFYAQNLGKWDTYLICEKCRIDYGLAPIWQPLDFGDSENGILIGNDAVMVDSNGINVPASTIYITSDGGKNWKKQITLNWKLGIIQYFRYFPPDFISGFIANRVVYSSDKGNSWQSFEDYTQNDGFIFLSGKVFSPSIFYKVAAPSKHGKNPRLAPAYIDRSLDSGQSYQLIGDTITSENYGFLQAYMQDSLNIWAIIKHDSLTLWTSCIQTTDGGLHWHRSFPADTSNGRGLGQPRKRIFGNDEHGTLFIPYAEVGDSLEVQYTFDILYTTDFGSTWQGDSSNHGRLAFVTSAGGSKLWGLIGTQGNNYVYHCDTLAYSPNYGKNWYYDVNAIRGKNIVNMFWKDSAHGYIISYADSTIWFSKYIPPPLNVNYTGLVYYSPTFTARPSVSSGMIHLKANEDFNGILQIYDVLGRLLSQTSLITLKGVEKIIDISSFTQGVYFFTFSSGIHISTTRVIKE